MDDVKTRGVGPSGAPGTRRGARQNAPSHTWTSRRARGQDAGHDRDEGALGSDECGVDERGTHERSERGCEDAPSARQDGTRASLRIAVLCPDSSVDASCFGAALAAYLVKVGAALEQAARPVVLVDGQPGTGGLDVVLDLETAPGARWPALRGAGAHVDGERLLAALPHRDGVAVLSHASSLVVVDDESRRATHEALARVGEAVVHCVAAHPLPALDEFDILVLLVRGTVSSMAAAEQISRALAEKSLDTSPADERTPELTLAIVTLETPERTRAVMAESLGAPVVASAPTRWRLGPECAKDLLAGRWPGQHDSTMTRLVRDVSMFVAGFERESTWA